MVLDPYVPEPGDDDGIWHNSWPTRCVGPLGRLWGRLLTMKTTTGYMKSCARITLSSPGGDGEGKDSYELPKRQW